MKNLLITMGSLLIAGSLCSQAATVILLDEDFSSNNIDTATFGGATTSDIGTGVWNGTTEWSIDTGAGTLNNTTDGTDGDRGVGIVLDVRSITDPQFSLINLEVSFTRSISNEGLYTHIRGYIDPDGDPATGSTGALVNNGATNGNLWNEAINRTGWETYNLHSGILNDHYSNYSSAGQALSLHPGSTAGVQYDYSTGFFMHNNAGGFTSLADFDYIGVYFTREAQGGTSGASLSIDSVLLRAVAAPEPSSLALLFIGGALLMSRNRKKLS